MEMTVELRRRWLRLTHITPVSIIREAQRRWQALDRGAKLTRAALIALVGAAVGVRVWIVATYPTAFMGFPDSSQYGAWAHLGIFRDPQRPAGYPFFLRLIHHFSDTLLFVATVQHVLGVIAGLLLYRAVRRTGAPAWLGLLPAAVVFFGGTGLFLEHSLLADPLFAFLESVVIYLTIVALYDPAWRWPLLTGLAIGVAFWVKTAAITNALLVPLLLVVAAPSDLRRRLGSALIVAIAAAAMILFYVGSQYYFTGYLGYERESAWNLYGRVATFADCSKFTPPPGTGALCIPEPPQHRQPPSYYIYSPESPANKLFVNPQVASLQANSVIKRFAVAAIVHEPLSYLEAVVRGLSYYVFPRAGEGYTPQSLADILILLGPPVGERQVAAADDIVGFYPGSPSYETGAEVHSLRQYERDTRVQGALLIAMLVFAIVGCFVVPARMRGACAVFTLSALSSIAFAVAAVSYDARYAYPTFGPLAAGAALGAWGVGSAIARSIRLGRRRGIAPSTPGEP